MDLSLPRRTFACAVLANCSAHAKAASRSSAWQISTEQAELLAAARDDARLILDRDPELASERGKALRVLLYLFERDSAVRLLRSG